MHFGIQVSAASFPLFPIFMCEVFLRQLGNVDQFQFCFKRLIALHFHASV